MKIQIQILAPAALILSILQLQLLTPTLYAAHLSLTSTNDYIYISMPTNRSVDIRGLGTGPEGLYTMPRIEDMMFLAEALSERRHVADALISDAQEVTTNKIWSVHQAPCASMPNYIDTFVSLFSNWMNGGIYGTNVLALTVDARVTEPKNLITQPCARDYYYDEYSNQKPDVAVGMIFANGEIPTSRKLPERMGFDERISWAGYPPSFIFAFGFVTNAYVDVVANSAPIYYRLPRCGSSGYNRVQSYDYDYGDRIYGYDYDSHAWLRNPVSDYATTNVYTTPYAKRSFRYSKSTSFSKTAHTAFEVGGSPVATTRSAAAESSTLSIGAGPYVTFPKFSNGTTFNGLINAYAIVDFGAETYSGTNRFRRIDKLIAIPTTLVQEGRTAEGYPVYRDRAATRPDIYFEACARITGIETMPTDDLEPLVDYPPYPSETSAPSRRSYRYSSTPVVDAVHADVVGYAGCADVTFRARVL